MGEHVIVCKRDKFLHTMFVQNLDTNNDIVECLNSRSHDPTPKLPIHTVSNFFRVTCSATTVKSGQPSKPAKPPTQAVVPTSSADTTPVQTTDAVTELLSQINGAEGQAQ